MENRLYYLDNLRVFLTILVIVHHVAMTYGTEGLWYFFDGDATHKFTTVMLDTFTVINQSFFMGLFFFLSGYFTPSSYDKKGPRLFIKERFIRLNTPIILYMLLISPIVQFISLQRNSLTFWQFYKTNILSLTSIEIGPLWFVFTLLIFQSIYFLVRIIQKESPFNIQKPFPGVKTLFISAFSIGIIAFLLRMIFPIGELIIGLQLGYFPAYILLFIAGIIAHRQDWLRNIPKNTIRNWARISLFISPIFPLGFIFLPLGKLEGGWNLLAFLYAMWEPFVGIGICITLLVGFRKYVNQTNPISKRLSDAAYTVYIIHSLIIVGYSVMLYGIPIHPLLKFGMVATIGTITCILVATAINKIPYAKRIL